MDSGTPLPEIDVDLVDTLSIGQNSLQTQLDSVKQDILSSIGGGDFLKQGLKYFLRKDVADYASGKITFRSGLESKGDVIIGESGFAGGLAGFGAKIDENGNGEMRGLTLWEWLSVPELRYNRVEVFLGIRWSTPGAGIILTCTPDTDADGNTLSTGTCMLKLEDGEFGAVSEDDIAMGIYHFGNGIDATDNSDDSRGNFTFAGFATCYFRITSVSGADNGTFTYALRQGYTVHPQPQMHFSCYGNFTDTTRQRSNYSTLTYKRYLLGVNTWEFSAVNIAAQFGDLTNLNVFGLEMSGYSAYLNNIYMTGTIEQFEHYPVRMEIDTQGDGFLAFGECMTVTCRVFRGWEDVTTQVTAWEAVRDSGDAAEDATWLLKDKVKNFAGKMDICFTDEENDLGNSPYLISTLFTFTATIDDGTQKEQVSFDMIV